MQRESPLHRGERFAIEAQLHAQWLDAVSYDVATFAMYLLDDEGGESPCFVHAWSFDAISRISDGFSDGPSSKRWTVVKETWAVENPWISDVRDIAKTD